MSDDEDLWASSEPLQVATAPYEVAGHIVLHGRQLLRPRYGEPPWSDLRAGRLFAFGIQTSPEPLDGPQRIKSFVFERAMIELTTGTVHGSGRVYESVRVMGAHSSPPDPLSTQRSVDSALESSEARPRRLARKGGGRADYDAVIRGAIRELEREQEHFHDWSKAKKVLAIQDKSNLMHRGKFPGSAKIGRSTVYRYFRLYPGS